MGGGSSQYAVGSGQYAMGSEQLSICVQTGTANWELRYSDLKLVTGLTSAAFTD